MPSPLIRLGRSGNFAIGPRAYAVAAALVVLGVPQSGALGTVDSVAPGGLMAQTDPDPNPVLLLPGAEGDDVMKLQRQMTELGIYQGPVDGRYGEGTRDAIASFQARAGLPASGTLDQLTWQRMGTPQLLANDTPAAAEPPVLLPKATDPQNDTEAAAETRDVSRNLSSAMEPQASTTAAELNGEPETESPELVEAGVAYRDRHLGWWLVGGLALVGSLGGWLWLGRGRSRPNLQNLDPALASGTVATTPLGTVATNADALVQADLPLEPTTRLSAVDIVDTLVGELASPDGARRRHAIWELGQRGHSAAIQPLINGLLEADSQEKSLILAALAEIGSRSLKPMHRALALGLQDPSPEVRKNAIRDLTRVYDTVVQLSPMLAHAAQDPDPGVQATAQWALSQLNRMASSPSIPPDSTTLGSAYDSDRLPPS